LFSNSPDQVAGGAAGQGLGSQPLERLRCLANQRGLVDRDALDRRLRVDDNGRVIETANEEPSQQPRVISPLSMTSNTKPETNHCPSRHLGGELTEPRLSAWESVPSGLLCGLTCSVGTRE